MVETNSVAIFTSYITMAVCRHVVLSLCLCALLTTFLEVGAEPCWLRLLDGSEYYTEDSGIRTYVKEAGLIQSGTEIFVTCLEGYDLVAINGGVKSVDNAQLVMCENGKWENVHICKKRITCNPPIEVQNAILREQFRNKRIFEEGEVVQYDCNLGYSIYGSSRERNCTASGWSEVSFQCNAIRCPYIPDPEHGRRLDGNNEAGLSTQFSCNLGYRLVGPSMFTCRVDGEWSPSGRPRCDPVLCPELGYLRNGNIFQATNDGLRNNYQSVAQYTCDYGYNINGTRSRTAERQCQADGTWDKYDFFCEVLKCEHIELYGGTVTYVLGEPRAQGSYAIYQCQDSHCMSPEVEQSECKGNTLIWDPSPPKCYRKLEPECPANGYCDRSRPLCQNDRFRIRCNSNYELYMEKNKTFLDRSEMTIINDNGTAVILEYNRLHVSAEDLPICEEERCDLSNLPNVVKVAGKIRSRSSHIVTCGDGYEFDPNTFVRVGILSGALECRKGTLSYEGKTFTGCVERSCTLNEYSLNDDTSIVDHRKQYRKFQPSSIVPHVTEIEFKCKNSGDYELKTKGIYPEAYIARCLYGKFYRNSERVLIDEFPTCQEKRCDSVNLPHTVLLDTFNHTITGKVQSRTELQASCEDKYEFESSRYRRRVDVAQIQCTKGSFHMIGNEWRAVTQCVEKCCEFVGYPENAHTIRHLNDDSSNFLADDSRICPHDQVVYKCQNDGFELYVNFTDTFLSEFSATCRFGEFKYGSSELKKKDFPVCIGKRCDVNANKKIKNTCYTDSFNDSTSCRENSFKINSGSSIYIVCKTDNELYDSSQSKYVGDTTAQRTCDKGQLKPEYTCKPERCSTDNIPTNSETLLKLFGDKNIEDNRVESGDTIYISCNDGYELYINGTNRVANEYPETFSSLCQDGKFDKALTEFPICTEKRCKLQIDGLCKDDDESCPNQEIVVKSGAGVRIKCNEGYKLYVDKRLENDTLAQCVKGNVLNEIECKPDDCRVDPVVNANVTPPYQVIQHGQKVQIECVQNYNIDEWYSKETKEVNRKTTKAFDCELGKWNPAYPKECLPDSCKLSIQAGSFYSTVDGNITEADLVSHGTVVNITCDDGFSLHTETAELAEVSEVSVTCKLGQWNNPHFCRNANSPQKETTGAPETMTSYRMSTEDMKTKSQPDISKGMEEKTLPTNQVTGDKASLVAEKECLLSSDWRFLYKKSNQHEVEPGTKIEDGTTLTVTCRTIDLYPYDYYGNDENDNSQGSEVITCSSGQLGSINIKCPDTDPPSCSQLENGKVTEYYDEYKVECNEGYELNLFNKDEPYCKCVDGGLLCKYGNQTPICEPEPCEIPHDYEDIMTIFIKKGSSIVSLSGGVNVAVGDKVFFNCRDTGDEFYEPVNRRFKCENGKWNEDEKDKEWRLGYNGSFPKCRNATCVPSCQNGGACIKDNKCRCPHLTTGSACEEILCDDECERNGGKCVAPGKCGNCPPGQYGDNCEKRGCRLPKDDHRIHPNDDWTEFGQSISDQNIKCFSGYKPNITGIITCLAGGRWSQIIECQKIPKIRYQITVRTGDAWTAGTGAAVYIYLIGEHYPSSKLTMWGLPTRNSELSTTVDAENVTPLRSVKVGRESVTFRDNWQLASVVVDDLTHRQHFMFKRDNPVWVNDKTDETLPLFASCDQECLDNGGSCLPLHTCKCPPGQHGQNCEERGCLYPENAPLKQRQKNIFSEGEIISGDDFDCLPSQRPEPPSMACLKNGSWTKTTRCVDKAEKVRYSVQVKTASDSPDAGSYTNVFVRLNGENGRSTGEHRVGGLYDHTIGALVEDSFDDIDISPIRIVTVRRQDGDHWRLEYVSVAVAIGDPKQNKSYYSFGESKPQWIQNNKPTEIYYSCHQECLDNGGWCLPLYACICPPGQHGQHCEEKVRYIVQVKTASGHPDDGSYTNVFVKLRGENGRSTVEHRVGGMYDHIRGALVEDSFKGIDISQIETVTVRMQGGDYWLLEYVSVAVDSGDPKKYKSYYSFGESRPQWIDSNKQKVIYRMTKECFEYQPYIDPFKHNDRRDVRYFETSPTEPESYCKSQCLLSKELSCKGVFFSKFIDANGRQGATCAAFSETDPRDFSSNHDKGLAKYFHRTC